MPIIQSVGNTKSGGGGKIKTASHCISAIDYIRREDKAYKIHYQNCDDNTSSRMADDFKLYRQSYEQDKGILCHHYYQSFPKKEKITPEQAHEFAKEFAKKVWSDFQVIISTHIDREHIHSHFIQTQPKVELLGLYHRPSDNSEYMHYAVTNNKGIRKDCITNGVYVWSDGKNAERIAMLEKVKTIDTQKMESLLNKYQPDKAAFAVLDKAKALCQSAVQPKPHIKH